MSNEVMLEVVKTTGIIITGAFSLIGLIYTIKTAHRTTKLETKSQDLETKVDEYNIKVDGNLTKLLETTRELAEHKATLIERDKGDAKAAELKAEIKADILSSATNPAVIPPINVGKVVVEAKEVNIQKPEDQK